MTEFFLLCKIISSESKGTVWFLLDFFFRFEGKLNMTVYNMYKANVSFYTEPQWMFGPVKSHSGSHVNLKVLPELCEKSCVKSRCEF